MTTLVPWPRPQLVAYVWLLALGAAALSGCVIEDTGDAGDVRRYDVHRPDTGDVTPPSDTTPPSDGVDFGPPPPDATPPPPPDAIEPVDMAPDVPPPHDANQDSGCFDCPPPIACTPSWEPDDPGVGCSPGLYCMPDRYVADLAHCVESNPAGLPEGSACFDASQCRTGLFCLDLYLEPNAPPEQVCTRVCNPTAPPGESGWCEQEAPGQLRACVPVWDDTGEVSAVGLCTDACRLDDLESFGCSPEPATARGCQVGRIFGVSGGLDLCVPIPSPPLSEFDDCAQAGLQELDWCKDNGLCLDLTGGGGSAQCIEFCSIDRGTVGSTGHPDCGDPAQHCADLFATNDFGVCR